MPTSNRHISNSKHVQINTNTVPNNVTNNNSPSGSRVGPNGAIMTRRNSSIT